MFAAAIGLNVCSGATPAAARAPQAPGSHENIPATRDAKAAPTQLLLVELTVNGLRQAEIVHAEQLADGRVLLARDGWQATRLRAPQPLLSMSDGTPGYALDSVPGLRYTVDTRRMAIDVHAPPDAFSSSTLDPAQALEAPPPRPALGALLNYDAIVVKQWASRNTAAATLEAVAFGPFGTAVTSAVLSDDEQGRKVARLDTFWQYEMPQSMQTLVVGDTIGVGGAWSRPVRFAGLRWGRDFGLRPGFVTMPLPSLSGEAALPSTVDLLVNDSRRLSQPVRPGHFDIANVPVVTGAGQVSLVVRDLLGRQTVITQDYYASNRLLAQGLSDFSVEAGRLRSGYGSDSRYGDPFAAGTLRRGLTPALTAEGRLELQAGRQATGFELASLMGNWGVAHAAVAASRDRLHGAPARGQLLQTGIERSTPQGTGVLQYEYASRGFAPFGESADPAAPARRSREKFLASIGGRLWGANSGGVSYARRVLWNGERSSTLALSLNVPLVSFGTLAIALARRSDHTRSWIGSINLSIPLGGDRYAGARVERDGQGHVTASVQAARNPPPGPGWGWRTELSTSEQQRARAGLQYNAAHGELTGEAVADAQAHPSVRAGARGSVGIMAGLPFASRPIGQGSFAVIQLEGMPGVTIKRSNQVVARTDERGLAFVPGLAPWQKNVIELEPIDLPLDAEVQSIVQEVVPYARTGRLVHFDVRRSRQALLVLQQADGQPVPVGTRVRLLPSGGEFTAGRRGEVWLTDLEGERQQVDVRWPAGGCELDLRIAPADNGAPASIGPLKCGERTR